MRGWHLSGRNIGGSGGISVSLWPSMISTILMRRQSKRGLRASKYGCSVTTSQQQPVSVIGAGALVGEAGNSLIEKLPQATTWAEVKEELCSVLGESDPKKRAFESLLRYKPKSKHLGEMAVDIIAIAAIATSDVDLQTQLGLKAFLQNMPESIGHQLRRRHFASVREALTEARFLQSVEEEEERANSKVFTVEAEAKPPVEKPKVDIQQIVKACMKQMQAQQPKKEQSERPRSSHRKLRCCGEEGHNLKPCSMIQQNQAACVKQKAEKRVPNGATECQMVTEGASRARMGHSWLLYWINRPPWLLLR